jgi:hypothetical protein
MVKRIAFQIGWTFCTFGRKKGQFFQFCFAKKMQKEKCQQRKNENST